MKLWLDAQCAAFVREEFPEYVAAYEGLQLAVERADLFRYLVVLRHGGLYSDTDTEVWNVWWNLSICIGSCPLPARFYAVPMRCLTSVCARAPRCP